MTKSIQFNIFSLILSSFLLIFSASASAIEGEWETGGTLQAMIAPSPKIFGAGLEVYARYSLTDSIKLSGGFTASAGYWQPEKKSIGIYSVRLGALYALDILEWVPSFGLHLSGHFSENKRFAWNKTQNGMGLDFDLIIQYRGFRQFGIGFAFSYHLLFVNADYLGIGLTFSWFSDEF